MPNMVDGAGEAWSQVCQRSTCSFTGPRSCHVLTCAQPETLELLPSVWFSGVLERLTLEGATEPQVSRG